MGCEDIYIVAACRTGIGAFQGQFKNISAATLGATVISSCLHRFGIQAGDVSEVIMGQVLTAGQGQNPARQAAIEAAIPVEVPAYTINMLSGSSLKAVYLGYQAICNGDAKLVVCGGQESMTLAHHSAYIQDGMHFQGIEVKDTTVTDGLTDAFSELHVGEIGEHLAKKHRVSREAQDHYAYKSHARAAKAARGNYFVHEVIPVQQNTPPLDITEDELVKPGMTFEKLSVMPPIFEKDPTQNPSITTGNSAKNADGAAAVIICNKTYMELMDLVPLARVVAFAQTGNEPSEMGLGQISAIERVLLLADWSKDNVDLFEIDEAFAFEAVVVLDKLGLSHSKVNIAGGSIALGHPLGASGARLLVTLLHNLHRTGLDKGIAAVGIGGGMGIAVAVERPRL